MRTGRPVPPIPVARRTVIRSILRFFLPMDRGKVCVNILKDQQWRRKYELVH